MRMTKPKSAKQRRLDRDLYAAEGVAVLGVLVILIGHLMEKSSHSTGHALVVTGVVILVIGLLAVVVIGNYLSAHFSRTAAYPSQKLPGDEVRGFVGRSGFRSRPLPTVTDPSAPLREGVQSDPENDAGEHRLIEEERQEIERNQQGFLND